MSTPSGFARQEIVDSAPVVDEKRLDYEQQMVLTYNHSSSTSSSPVLTRRPDFGNDVPYSSTMQLFEVPSDIDVMAQLASQFYSFESRNRSHSAPVPPSSLPFSWHYNNQSLSLDSPLDTPFPLSPSPINMAPVPAVMETQLGVSGAPMYLPNTMGSVVEPENEPIDSPDKMASIDAISCPLPATFLRTICNQMEFYFCDDNLLGDLFLLKNMNDEGYVKLELVASFGRVRKLTTDMEQVRAALELSTKLIMDETQTMVCRKELLPATQTYHGKLARTAIAYNLPENSSVASLRETFATCGEITYIRLLKQNTSTGQNAVLKPPIVAGETYLIIEFLDDEMTKHAVLTLSDAYNTETGMQVVLFDGTTSERLKQKMFPPVMDDRRRAKSTSAVPPRPVHVDSVGEGLEDLKEGKVNTGIVYSIRGAGGLIKPTRLEACISFRLIPDEDGNFDIRAGDYVSFTVGKNKKSGRKYASKVKLEFRPPSSGESDKDYFSASSSRWESRNRSATVGASPPVFKRSTTASAAPPAPPMLFRGRSMSSGTRPKLNLTAPSPRGNNSPPQSNSLSNANGSYRQALGPDGTRGFGSRRTGETAEMMNNFKAPLYERRRSTSNSAVMLR